MGDFESLCFEVLCSVWFGMPNIFDMPFLPDFSMLGCFDVPVVILVVILKYLIRSTGIFRYAKIPRFGRPEMARNAEIF